MDKIKEVNIDGERLFLKKSKTGWRIVYPIKIDGKINKKNLFLGGSWWNIVKIGLLIGAILFVTWAYSHDIEAVKQSCQPFIIVP